VEIRRGIVLGRRLAAGMRGLDIMVWVVRTSGICGLEVGEWDWMV
jgi:hypothetical protein